jgi:hypothetical protein
VIHRAGSGALRLVDGDDWLGAVRTAIALEHGLSDRCHQRPPRGPRNQDLQRLSPLASKHINQLGRFHFELPAPVPNGQRWPLKTPEPETTCRLNLKRNHPFPFHYY